LRRETEDIRGLPLKRKLSFTDAELGCPSFKSNFLGQARKWTICFAWQAKIFIDSRLRGNDKEKSGMTGNFLLTFDF